MQFMETINMGNLINSRLAFIELIKILYQISCSGEQDVYRNNCDKLVAVLCQIRTYHLMPLSLLPTSFETMLLDFTDGWQVGKVHLAQTLYIFLARTMYSSEVANIYNSAEYKQGLEMCRVQFPYEEIVKWLKDVDFNEQEVLNDYFYFILNPDVRSFNDAEEYTIYHYQKDCRKLIKEVQGRGKTPILVGGTGLYIKAALYDYKLTEEKETNTYDNLTDEELYNKLLEVDKDIVIDKNNRRRLIRALNYYKENNKSINTNTTNKLLYDAIFIGLTTDRRILYDKINTRVDIMIKEGLLNEVKVFYDKNIRTKPLLNAIGYREIYSYFDGNISLEEAIDKIKQNSRHYAKRQYTFFNHQLPVVWFETDYSNFNNTVEKVINYIENN